MKRLSMDIVDSFKVSQRDARFASLVYSGDAEVNFNFVRYDDTKQVKQALKSLTYGDVDTSIDKALELAKSDIFSLQGKVRTRRPMVLVVFIDGDLETGPKDLEKVVAPLKDYGVKVVVIQVGSGSSSSELQLNKIAFSENSLFKAESFNDVLPELYSIAKEACNGK